MIPPAMLPSADGSCLPEGFTGLIDVFHGDMTCCKMGHNNGTTPCDQEKLVKPMLGLLVELYRDRHDDAAARVIWNAIEPNLAKLYPKNFDYACGPGGRTERRALFGDLVTAMYYRGHVPALAEVPALGRAVAVVHGRPPDADDVVVRSFESEVDATRRRRGRAGRRRRIGPVGVDYGSDLGFPGYRARARGNANQ